MLNFEYHPDGIFSLLARINPNFNSNNAIRGTYSTS